MNAVIVYAAVALAFQIPSNLMLTHPPDAPGVIPQNDGNSGHDADNECQPGQGATVPLENATELHGILFPVDDPSDIYLVQVSEGPQNVSVFMDPAHDLPDGLPVPDFDLEALGFNCQVLNLSAKPGNVMEHLTFPAPVPGNYSVRVYLPNVTLSIQPLPDPEWSGNGRMTGPGMPLYCHPPCTSAGYNLTGIRMDWPSG